MSTIEIPQGFVLGYCDCCTLFSLEENGIVVAPMTKVCQCGPDSNCTSNRNCVLMNGELTYVVTVQWFRSACSIEDCDTSIKTSFSTTGTILINKVMAYEKLCDCVIPAYTITDVKCEEFITFQS